MLSLRGFFGLAGAVDRLMTLEEKHGGAISRLEAKLTDLDHRVTRLEAREDIVVEQAKGAAAASAAAVVMQSVTDTARRIGGLEARTSSLRLAGSE